MLTRLIKNKILLKLKNQSSGLTLVEVLIAVAIFSLLSVVVGGIYLAFSNSQDRTQVAQKLLNDAQYALESMAREVRGNKVYYNYSNCDAEITVVQTTQCLILEKSDGTIVAFAVETDGGGNPEVINYLVKEAGVWTKGGVIFDINQNQGVIDSILFLVSPAAPGVDPLEDGGGNQNPLVTIEMQLSTNATRSFEQVTYNLQTSVSPRVYKR
ncbi:type II secretion system protein [Candidatus Nomurabacteria bacterium]|nr:type II secretion system protein [Candidatus Nomurabacteria bacterium]